jgi:hypothetical protein
LRAAAASSSRSQPGRARSSTRRKEGLAQRRQGRRQVEEQAATQVNAG